MQFDLFLYPTIPSAAICLYSTIAIGNYSRSFPIPKSSNTDTAGCSLSYEKVSS